MMSVTVLPRSRKSRAVRWSRVRGLGCPALGLGAVFHGLAVRGGFSLGSAELALQAHRTGCLKGGTWRGERLADPRRGPDRGFWLIVAAGGVAGRRREGKRERGEGIRYKRGAVEGLAGLLMDPSIGLCFHRLRFHFEAKGSIFFPPYKSTNILRGAFGTIFRRIACLPECREPGVCPLHGACAYEQVFAPIAREKGPSGFRDVPRPLVFRASHLDGRTVNAGETFWF